MAYSLKVTLGTCDYQLVDLSNDFHGSTAKLVAHIKSVIADNEAAHGLECKKFYIGKSFVHTWKGRIFDPHKPKTTWRKEGINNRWWNHRNNGFDNMAVLAVVTNDNLPPFTSAEQKQQYTIAQEQELISHFMFEENDQRLENKTTEPGRLEGGSAVGYVLYLCMKFRDFENPPLFLKGNTSVTPLSTISWVNPTPPLALIYPHLEQFSQPYRSFTDPWDNPTPPLPLYPHLEQFSQPYRSFTHSWVNQLAVMNQPQFLFPYLTYICNQGQNEMENRQYAWNTNW